MTPKSPAYLRDTLKDGPALHVIENLTHDAEFYKEAIDCLRKRNDQARVIHQAHTRAILEASPLKDGNSKELRRLHDVARQHLRALRVMKYEAFASLVTSILELKLDHTTIFEWQRHTQYSNAVPDVDKLLEFLDLPVRAGENGAREGERRRQAPLPEKGPSQNHLIQLVYMNAVWHAKQPGTLCMAAKYSRVRPTIGK